MLHALGQLQAEDQRGGVDLAVVRARALELLAGTDAAGDIAPQVGSYAGLEQHAWDLRDAGFAEIMTGAATINRPFHEAHQIGGYGLRITPAGREALQRWTQPPEHVDASAPDSPT